MRGVTYVIGIFKTMELTPDNLNPYEMPVEVPPNGVTGLKWLERGGIINPVVFFFFILRRMGKTSARAHHTCAYFHTRRVSI